MRLRTFYGILGAIVAAGTIAGAAVSFAAMDNAAAMRKAIMKDVGAAAGVVGPMLKGEKPFDATAANMAARVWHTAALAFPHYFPEGSQEADGDSIASPKAWEDAAGLQAASAAFAADAAAAVAAEGEEAVKAAIGKAFANCGSCHEKFRLKK